MLPEKLCHRVAAQLLGFNGHPPLGVNATREVRLPCRHTDMRFNGHPPLGVNATEEQLRELTAAWDAGFNGHPPLGVNATQTTAAQTA